MKLGATLKKNRERKELSLREVEGKLKEKGMLIQILRELKMMIIPKFR